LNVERQLSLHLYFRFVAESAVEYANINRLLTVCSSPIVPCG